MAAYNKYLDGLMASCQRIVEQSYHQAHYLPQYLVSHKHSQSPVMSPPTISESPLPAATAPSNLALVSQSPILSSASAHASPTTHEATSPAGQAAPRQMMRGGLQNEPVQGNRYESLPWRTLSKMLTRRGLDRSGTRAELAKRLKEDDEFQMETSTAVDYDKMDLKDLCSLCIRRSIASQGTAPMLRNRLKTYDERRLVKEGAGSKVNDGGEMSEEEAFPSTTKDNSTQITKLAESTRQTAETGIPAIPKDYAEFDPIKGMQPGQHRHKACNACRKAKRRCVHGANGNEDFARVVKSIQEFFEKPASNAHIKGDSTGLVVSNPAPAAEKLAGERVTRARESTAKASVVHGKLKTPAKGNHSEKDGERARVSTAKSSISQSKLKRKPEHVENHMTKKDGLPKSRRPQLLYTPNDEILLLRICINLKDVIDWGDINGFWNMVQDTLQQETRKPYMKVSRHVRILVDKRRAEQEEIKQEGKIVTSRLSAGCRPLLDTWIAGGNRHEHEDDVGLGEKESQQLDSDNSALESQKRSATDAWLDTSCDTTRCKKPKLRTSELSNNTSKSSIDSARCWSLSGSSVTSDSSVEDESDGEDERR